MDPYKAHKIITNPEKYSKAEVKEAQKFADMVNETTAQDKTTGSTRGATMDAPPKKPKMKKKMAKGGYANCGASMPASQKSSQKMAKGGLLKKPDNPGLAKLPTPVRNKMGYMMKGGYAKKK